MEIRRLWCWVEVGQDIMQKSTAGGIYAGNQSSKLTIKFDRLPVGIIWIWRVVIRLSEGLADLITKASIFWAKHLERFVREWALIFSKMSVIAFSKCADQSFQTIGGIGLWVCALQEREATVHWIDSDTRSRNAERWNWENAGRDEELPDRSKDACVREEVPTDRMTDKKKDNQRGITRSTTSYRKQILARTSAASPASAGVGR